MWSERTFGIGQENLQGKNRTVLDEDGSYIEDKATGLETKIEDSEDGEGYVLSLVVPRKEEGVKKEMVFRVSKKDLQREKNRIVLDEDGSYIEDKATGLRGEN
jgi:hypothetical protein